MAKEWIAITAQGEYSGLVHRLISARKAAELTAKQADARLDLEAGTTARFEDQQIEPSIRMFLAYCQLYNVAPSWVFTGIDPYVDTAELVNLLYVTKTARDKLDEVYVTMERVPVFQPPAASPANE